MLEIFKSENSQSMGYGKILMVQGKHIPSWEVVWYLLTPYMYQQNLGIQSSEGGNGYMWVGQGSP